MEKIISLFPSNLYSDRVKMALVPTSFPGLSYEDEARHEKALGLGRSILHSDWLTPYCLKITELDS